MLGSAAASRLLARNRSQIDLLGSFGIPREFLQRRSKSSFVVRVKGLEPPRLAAPEPKSGASANFATPARTSIA